MSSNIFEKQNAEPLQIEYIEDEHDEARDYTPTFWHNNRRYYLEDFIRVHNNPWFDPAGFPEYIHGVEAGNYYAPLYIEIIGGEEVNVYRAAEEGSRE